MTNAELEQHILTTLRERPLHSRAGQLLEVLPVPRPLGFYRQLDRALQRLRKRGLIEFRGPVQGWALR